MKKILVARRMEYLTEDMEKKLKKAERARTQTVSDLCADMAKGVNNPDYSDVFFVCKDGIRVYSSRLLLVTRSEVFNRMLRNGMVESQRSEINLPEITSTTLLPVMEFLYTGSLREHSPKDWKNAYDIIGAARMFLLEGLEFIAISYLLQAAADVRMDAETSAKFLSIAVEFVGIIGETVEIVARDLVCNLQLVPTFFKPEHLQGLTGNAFLYFLEKTKNDDGEPRFLSNAEVIRLKNILLWCAWKEFSPKELLTLHDVPLEFTCVLELLERSPVQQEFMASHQAEIFGKIRDAFAVSVRPYLHFVDLRRIPTRFLVNVLEPMDVIPSPAIMDAFRFQALRTYLSMEPDTDGWWTSSNDHEMYRIGRDGSRIEQIVPGIGFARFNFKIENEGRYKYVEWEIIIEEVCESFIEIGLLHGFGPYFDGQDDQRLSRLLHGWALRMDPQACLLLVKVEIGPTMITRIKALMILAKIVTNWSMAKILPMRKAKLSFLLTCCMVHAV